MKRVLVTGIGGFVAHHFIEHLLVNTDWEIVGLDSFRHKGCSRRLQHLISNKRLSVFTHDLTTPITERLAHVIGPIDYIVNIASESHVPRSIENPVAFVKNNIDLMLSILEFARMVKAEKFIQCSSDEVFGPAFDSPHTEWDINLPSSPYSASKAMQNNLAFSYWRTYKIPIILTHTMNMFGERQDPEKFIPLLISKITKGEIVKIHGSKDKIGRRHYIHSRNLSDAWLYLLRHEQPTHYESQYDHMQLPSAFNISGEDELDNLSLAQLVSSLMDKPLKYEFIAFDQARPGHDFRYALDGSKIAKLGWKAPVEFKESLERVVKWTLNNKEWMI